MRVFGIDPGSQVTGWGVVERERGRYRFIAAGTVRTRTADPIGVRLGHIHQELCTLLALHAPVAVSIEEIFRHRSSESAIRLGQARGVALLAASQAGFEAVAYNPMTVKRTIGAHGRADKAAVARMVRMLLGEIPPLAADATDALAIAMTHCAHMRPFPTPEVTR